MRGKKDIKRAIAGIMTMSVAVPLVLPTIPIQAALLPVQEEGVTARFGTPVVDGTIDEVWNKASIYELVQPDERSDVQGQVRLLWDDNALYILTEVFDETLDKSAANAYEQDSVEVFLDELYDRTSSYGEDDLHYRVNYENTRTTDKGDGTRWYTATSLIDGEEADVSGGDVSGGNVSGDEGHSSRGYIVEAYIQWDTSKVVPENDREYGFDVQVNAAEGGRRQGTVSLYDASGNAWQDTTKFGKLVLKGKEDGQQSAAAPYALKKCIEDIEKMDLTVYVNGEAMQALLDEAKELLNSGTYTQEQLDDYVERLEAAKRNLDDGSGYTSPYDLPEKAELPDIFTFYDGETEVTRDNWASRAEEIKKAYDYYMYGPMPDTSTEIVTYELGEWKEEEVSVNDPITGEKLTSTVKRADFTIKVEDESGAGSFKTTLTLPAVPAPEGGYPIFSYMGGVDANVNYAAIRGYAAVTWTYTDVASDDLNRTGLFYELHPYGTSYKEQTGALVAWGWGAGKILDALYNGAAAELNINADNNILAGVSRLGKATAVAGAYDKRIKVVMPTCSGAGGMATFRYSSNGKTYDLASAGYYQDGSSLLTIDENEHLGSLQSTDERHWFNDNFLKFSSVQQFPFDQYYLASLMADPDRYLFIVAGHNGENWTNPPGMAMTYLAAREVYDLLGLRDHLIINIHESNESGYVPNHKVLLEDMAYLLDFCDIKLYGKSEAEVTSDLREVKTTAFFDDANWATWEGALDRYVGNNLTSVDWQRLVKKPVVVEHGATLQEVVDALPEKVNIYVDEARYRGAEVTWNPDSVNYDPSLKIGQTLEFTGTITLPEGVTNPDNLSLVVKAAAFVEEEPGTVKYKNIVVDGVAEEAWEDAPVYTTTNLLDSAAGSTDDGTADIRFLWDDAYLYIMADVKDTDVYSDGGSDEKEDSITFTVAQNRKAGKNVRNFVITADGSALNISWAGEFSWSSFSAQAYKKYEEAEDVYVKTGLTGNGWHMEACIAWEDLGIEAVNGGELALEAIVNNCSSEKADLEYRKAMFSRIYPENKESIPVDLWGMTFDASYNAGFYAENLAPFIVGEKNTTAVAENIGRYSFIKIVENYEEQHVKPYPIQYSFDRSILMQAKSYALSADATKEGIAQWQGKLDAMQEKILKDNHYGNLMAKYGTPLVDGVSDKVWDSAYPYTTTKTEDGQYAEIRTLWDDSALYIRTKVFDPKYDVSGGSPHEQDSVEFFFMEPEDAAKNSFGKNGGQWRINRNNRLTVTFGANERFYGVVKELEDGKGYVVEARIAFAEGMDIQAFSTINFDICVNICADGKRTDAVAWTSTDCYMNPRTAGQLDCLEAAAEGSTIQKAYNPYALLKVLDKALIMEAKDYDAEDFAAHYDREKLRKYYDEAVSGGLTEKQLRDYYDDVIKMMSQITYDGKHISALGFEADHSFPDTFTMEDGTRVTDRDMWEERRAEIKDLYEFYMYGKLPVPEETGLTESFSVNMEDSEYTVTLNRGDVENSFTFKLYLPEGEAPEGGWPYIINYGGNIDGAQDAGYAVIGFSNHSSVADGSNYAGIFYELYPECKGNEKVTGVGPLAGRAWGVGRIIDCVEAGTGELSRLNPKNSAITGFSYLGKTALITGALEERIAVTNPQHSGIGGAALFRWSSQGKFYSDEEYKLGKDWLMCKQEPIGQVQGQGAAWVKTLFADFLGGDNVPFESYMLMSLIAPRGLYVSAGYYDQGTDPEAMYGAYLNAQDTYELLGVKEKIAFGNFPTEHATSSAENQAFFAFCDYYFYGKELPENFYQTVYDNSPNRPEYDVIRIPSEDEPEKPDEPQKPVEEEKNLLEIVENLNAEIDEMASLGEEDRKAKAQEKITDLQQKVWNEVGLSSTPVWTQLKEAEQKLAELLETEVMYENQSTVANMWIDNALFNVPAGKNATFRIEAADKDTLVHLPEVSGKICQNAIALDMKLMCEGIKTDIKVPVMITISRDKLPVDLNHMVILHLADGATVFDNVPFVVEGNFIKFKADGFSVYVFAELKEKSAEDKNPGDSRESSGDNSEENDDGAQQTPSVNTPSSTGQVAANTKAVKKSNKKVESAEKKEEVSAETSANDEKADVAVDDKIPAGDTQSNQNDTSDEKKDDETQVNSAEPPVENQVTEEKQTTADVSELSDNGEKNWLVYGCIGIAAIVLVGTVGFAFSKRKKEA